MPHAIPLPPPTDEPLTLLAGLTPAQFMRRHWQKKPLLVRGAIPGFKPILSRAQLFALAVREQVESRLIVRQARGQWLLEHGPFRKSRLPARNQPGWTLLVQGVDLHHEAAHALLQSFRFVPDARLDDLMISWASTGGGVGPHVDSYDVFLLQAQGQRRWRIARQKNPRFKEDVPLKILKRFVAEEEYLLEPGDMLYLPPSWAHDGVAEHKKYITYSIKFQTTQHTTLAAEIAERLVADYEDDALYADPQGSATEHPAAIPLALRGFATAAVRRLVADSEALAEALGSTLTEPKPGVLFDEPEGRWAPGALVLDRRTRMMYDGRSVFINGECYRATGNDARLMRRLADERRLEARAVRRASSAARSLLAAWFGSGWLRRLRD